MSYTYSDPKRASETHALPFRQASIWYRAGDDPETSVRPYAQMTLGADILDSTLRSLAEQGYRVQRVTVETLCGACKGAGREFYRPKGMRIPRSAPRVFYPQRACRACKGAPILASEALADARQHEEG